MKHQITIEDIYGFQGTHVGYVEREAPGGGTVLNFVFIEDDVSRMNDPNFRPSEEFEDHLLHRRLQRLADGL